MHSSNETIGFTHFNVEDIHLSKTHIYKELNTRFITENMTIIKIGKKEGKKQLNLIQ